jgi:hypothetical protein
VDAGSDKLAVKNPTVVRRAGPLTSPTKPNPPIRHSVGERVPQRATRQRSLRQTSEHKPREMASVDRRRLAIVRSNIRPRPRVM